MNIYIGEPVEYSDMQGPAPSGFHVPLQSEWQGVITIMNGLSLTTGNSRKINLHMPFAGSRNYSTTNLDRQGSYGFYWSSSPNSAGSSYARNLYLRSSSVGADDGNPHAFGLSIRCFKDSYETPTSSWTVVQGTLGSAGIFWNQSQGLISITDGTTGYTMMDKNLGATTVYNDGNSLTQANMGNMYQWGNNYGFPSTGSISKTSSTQVNASLYGPGNYYESDTFITGYDDWSSVHVDNLRGGVSQQSGTKSVEVQNIYIGKKPYEGKELCFTAQEANSTVTLNKYDNPTTVTLETSTDGETWSTYTFGTTITLSNVGDKVYWRNTSTTTTGFSKQDNYYRFSMTGTIAASGDLNYLINKNSTTTLVGKYCFYQLFENCPSLTSAPELPATTLTEACYAYLFGRTSITTSPKLPATTLAVQCYITMFWKCTALNTLPKLPATTLTTECYKQMFQGCTSIKLSSTQTGEYQTAYRIPTTGTGTTATSALGAMFYGTGGTYTSDPTINTTYYTSNTVV